MKADRYILRQKMVSYARRHGINAAVRAFGCDRNTVRKWLRRYKPGRPSTLNEQSKAPHSCPHKTSEQVAGQIVKLRRQTGFGAKRLTREFNLPCGEEAVRRILKEHGLTRPRKKKHKTKRRLRETKRTWKLFSQISADTKYLNDIPQYWPQMQHMKLPRFQYTAREVVSGLCFTGYADELSKSYSTLLAEQVSAHLAFHGVDLSTVEWQTDNGSEYLDKPKNRGYPSRIRALGSDHHFIPPKAYTWQSDVETVHRLIEDEFFDLESYRSRAQFWKKLTTYWLYFNLARPNTGKELQTPLQIIRQAAPELPPQIAAWLPLDLGRLHATYERPSKYQGGDDLPPYPCRAHKTCDGDDDKINSRS